MAQTDAAQDHYDPPPPPHSGGEKSSISKEQSAAGAFCFNAIFLCWTG